MKPSLLKIGDIFRVSDSCDEAELKNKYQVITIETSEIVLSNRKIPGHSKLLVRRLSDNAEEPMIIGPWVELTVEK